MLPLETRTAHDFIIINNLQDKYKTCVRDANCWTGQLDRSLTHIVQVRRRNPDLGGCKWLIASPNHLLQEILMPKSEIRVAKASASSESYYQAGGLRAVGLTSLLQASRTWTIWSTQPDDNLSSSSSPLQRTVQTTCTKRTVSNYILRDASQMDWSIIGIPDSRLLKQEKCKCISTCGQPVDKNHQLYFLHFGCIGNAVPCYFRTGMENQMIWYIGKFFSA